MFNQFVVRNIAKLHRNGVLSERQLIKSTSFSMFSVPSVLAQQCYLQQLRFHSVSVPAQNADEANQQQQQQQSPNTSAVFDQSAPTTTTTSDEVDQFKGRVPIAFKPLTEQQESIHKRQQDYHHAPAGRHVYKPQPLPLPQITHAATKTHSWLRNASAVTDTRTISTGIDIQYGAAGAGVTTGLTLIMFHMIVLPVPTFTACVAVSISTVCGVLVTLEKADLGAYFSLLIGFFFGGVACYYVKSKALSGGHLSASLHRSHHR